MSPVRNDDFYFKHISSLRNLIKEKHHHPISSVKDFEFLAEKINISTQTLRRFFGKIDADKKLSNTSLNIISQYVGYTSWENFCNQYEKQNTNTQNDALEMIFAFYDTVEFAGGDFRNKYTFDVGDRYAKFIINNDEYIHLFLERFKENKHLLCEVIACHPSYDKCASAPYIRHLERYTTLDLTPHIQVSMNSFLAFGAFLSGDEARFHYYFAKASVYIDECRTDENFLVYFPEIRFCTARLINAYISGNEEEYETIINEEIKHIEYIKEQDRHPFDDVEWFYISICDFFLLIENLEWANKIYAIYKNMKFNDLGRFIKISKINRVSIKENLYTQKVFALLETLNGNTPKYNPLEYSYIDWCFIDYNKIKTLKIDILNAKTLKDKKEKEKELMLLYQKLNYRRFIPN